MAVDPLPKIHQFTDGDSFDDPVVLAHFNRNVLTLRGKFGALTMNDLEGSTLDPEGAYDSRSNKVSNIQEAAGVINLKVYDDAGVPPHTVIANMTSGGIAFVPPNWSIAITHTIVMEDDVEIWGGGASSALFHSRDVSLNPGINLIEGGTAKRWAVRNIRLTGSRELAGNTVGAGIKIANIATCDVTIENVTFGPKFGGLLTGSFASTAIYLSSVDNVKVLGCHINRTAGEGIRIEDSEYITVSECFVNECGTRTTPEAHGVTVIGGKDVIFQNNVVRKSSRSSMYVSGTTFIAVHGCDFQNASTKTPEAKDNLFGNDTNGMLVVDNFFSDPASSTSPSLPLIHSIRYHLNHSTTNMATGLVVTGNWMDETSNSAPGGRVTRLDVGTNVLSTYVRDNNHVAGVGPGMKPLRNSYGGWSQGTDPALLSRVVGFRSPALGSGEWNARRFADTPGSLIWRYETPDESDVDHPMNYAPSVPENLAAYRPKRSFLVARRNTEVTAPLATLVNKYEYQTLWSPDGSVANALPVNTMDTACSYLAPNGPGLLTPAVLGSSVSSVNMTSFADELQAIQACYGVFEDPPNRDTGRGGILRRVPAGGEYTDASRVFYMWGVEVVSNDAPHSDSYGRFGTHRSRCGATLSCFVTDTSPYQIQTTNHPLDTQGPYLVVWGSPACTVGTTGDYADRWNGTTDPANFLRADIHWLQRSTWTTLHM